MVSIWISLLVLHFPFLISHKWKSSAKVLDQRKQFLGLKVRARLMAQWKNTARPCLWEALDSIPGTEKKNQRIKKKMARHS